MLIRRSTVYFKFVPDTRYSITYWHSSKSQAVAICDTLLCTRYQYVDTAPSNGTIRMASRRFDEKTHHLVNIAVAAAAAAAEAAVAGAAVDSV